MTKNVKLHWSCHDFSELQNNAELKAHFESDKQMCKDKIKIDDVVKLINTEIERGEKLSLGGINMKDNKLAIEFIVNTSSEMLRKSICKLFLFQFMVLPINLKIADIIDIGEVIDLMKRESIHFIVIDNDGYKLY